MHGIERALDFGKLCFCCKILILRFMKYLCQFLCAENLTLPTVPLFGIMFRNTHYTLYGIGGVWTLVGGGHVVQRFAQSAVKDPQMSRTRVFCVFLCIFVCVSVCICLSTLVGGIVMCRALQNLHRRKLKCQEQYFCVFLCIFVFSVLCFCVVVHNLHWRILNCQEQ